MITHARVRTAEQGLYLNQRSWLDIKTPGYPLTLTHDSPVEPVLLAALIGLGGS